MERMFISPPMDFYESHEDKFNTVIEYLQECVDDDILAIEDANEIADVAYDKYMLEKKNDKNKNDDESKLMKLKESLENDTKKFEEKIEKAKECISNKKFVKFLPLMKDSLKLYNNMTKTMLQAIPYSNDDTKAIRILKTMGNTLHRNYMRILSLVSVVGSKVTGGLPHTPGNQMAKMLANRISIQNTKELLNPSTYNNMLKQSTSSFDFMQQHMNQMFQQQQQDFQRQQQEFQRQQNEHMNQMFQQQHQMNTMMGMGMM